jgi:hypothetical protein
VLWLSRALGALSASLDFAPWLTFATYAGYMAIGGALYGRILMRAANDRRGGWLFGISYGFLLWMLGPVTILQWLTRSPVAVGGAAQGLFAAHLAYGLALGWLFPRVHRWVQKRLPDTGFL